ncbi:hypothetical protein [Chitinophaga sancti]|uniref:Lipoprotein n=1 Tax=Chitinophaga sancti TaxID=1004 RepID=A0A1K1MGJ8_9BACT|nr:hypothetical protein [Chitinophaga sancti]WQD62664.1 hypothetical protein U0033_32740 [Chitinophaga sancti]WQG91712.1 hypothetical protein SR876_09365 [Chitinophaga sancti]SFW22209.1 hypothetical protein SAMN05661012_00552 [Chitinophaga sancti]
MKFLKFAFFLILPFFAFCQDTSKLNVDAQYISLYLKNKNGNAYWKEMSEMPAGDFKCQEKDNGNLMVIFNKNEPPFEFINNTINYKEEIRKIPNDICGFKFKGFYYMESQPVDLVYAFYYSSKMPNSLVMVKYMGFEQVIFGANYYSDKKVNPLKEANYKFDLK